ncbi:phosphotransferase [Kitasatospora sp. MMS16-BH015]|uniref:phosphotransferase n=1 Tax=Kitasatospora sp. MMS16-BH015 TaxID=2018025 RepID=UPI00131A4DB3|nr:phosphotransferase [Kitasatospora sp. MMS16-BH015]
MLGDAHGTAWTYDLRGARLDRPRALADGAGLPDYVSPRRRALERRLLQGFISDREALDLLLGVLGRTADGPAAFYKDANPRNVLITASTVYTVDVDDLTLAPFGYDLAKLIHTLALSHGPLPPQAVRDAVQHYNTAAGRHHRQLGYLTTTQLDDFLLLHRALTAPYTDRDHYRNGRPQPLTQEAQ